MQRDEALLHPELVDGAKVHWRCWRDHRPKPKPVVGTLSITRREKDLPKKHRAGVSFFMAGDILSVGIKELHDWAEYGPEDMSYEDTGRFWLEVEGWNLEFKVKK